MQSIVKEASHGYFTFVGDITAMVKELMGEEFDVKIYKVTKNNSLELESLVILKKGENYSPNIYLLPYYESYLQEVPIFEVAQRIVNVYRNYTVPILREKFSYTYEQVKAFVTYRLVSFHKNRKLLNNIPYIKYLDLAITFHCLVRDDSDGIGTIRITNEHIQMWGVSQQELFELAICNTRILFPYTIKSMEEVIWGMIKEDCKNQSEDMQKDLLDSCINTTKTSNNQKMYILTNQKGINGATCLLYEDILKDFGEQIQSDFYILPSSIHEVILVPYSKSISRNALNEMVIDVNRTQVSREEVLSDRVYFFSREDNIITMS